MRRLSFLITSVLFASAIACSSGGVSGSSTPTTYSISGNVSGHIVSGVTVSLSGTSTASTTTDSSGNYSFTGLANGSYTITPSVAGGYAFSPPSKSVTVNGANVTGQDFADAGAEGVSGTVSGAVVAGVTVSLSGVSTASTTTDSSGDYSFTGLVNGNYTVTPSLAGYVFSPLNASATVNGANVTSKDFTATANANPHGISGTVSGLVATGVTVTLSGANSATTTTDGSGNYSFSGLADGSYTVTPSLAGYVFTPANSPVTVSGANVTGKNFTSTGAYGISGTISGLVASGVNVTLAGAASASTTTDGSGNYTFIGLANGSYTVTPSQTGYAFSPLSSSVTVSGANVTGENFTSTGAYSISGTVSGRVASGVTMTLSGASSATTTTDGSGNYSFGGLANGSYTVTPSLAGGYIFTPNNTAVTVSGASVTGQNFTDNGANVISGTVSGLVTSGVTVTLSGTSSATTTTDGSGNYSFAGLTNGGYTVTPSLAGYAFNPASKSVTLSGTSATGQNFTSTGAYGISGTVSGVVVSGVSMNLTGAATATTTTDGSGNYSFSGLANGSYTVTPSLPGYTFTPTSKSVTVNGASATSVNFSDTGTAYSISGSISGAIAAGVTVRLSGASTAITTTDGSGNYSFGSLANGQTYTVTPSMAGYSFSPTSTTVTISLANGTANFSASQSGSPVVTFSGQVSYSGARAGAVFLTIGWQNQGSNVAGGTSIAAPGSFTVHGVQVPGSFPATAVVTVWRDALDIGTYNAAADPFYTTTVSVSSTNVSLGTLTLADPSSSTPAAPTAQFVLPADSAAAVGFKGPTDSQGNPLADHFNIYWSTTANPGPSNKASGAPLTVVAGPNFGVVYGLSDGQTYYFSVSSLANGNESAATNVGSATTIGQVVPTGGYNITGTVTFPALTGANTLFVIAQVGQNGNGQPFVTRLAIPNSSTTSLPYTLPVANGATYDLMAFIDRGSTGNVGPTDPGLFGGNFPAAQVTVNGSNVAAPTFGLPTGNAAASLWTQNYGGSGASLNFEVDSNLKLPVSVQITAGPNVLVPVDVGISNQNNNNTRYELQWSLSPTTPQVGDTYTLHVTYSDGTSEDLSESVTNYLTSPPGIGSPVDGATSVGTTPTFSWSAPSSPPTGTYYYYINVYPNGGGNGWNYGPMPSSQTSVAYNVDGSGPALQTGQPYQWNISVIDSSDDQATAQASFTP